MQKQNAGSKFNLQKVHLKQKQQKINCVVGLLPNFNGDIYMIPHM